MIYASTFASDCRIKKHCLNQTDADLAVIRGVTDETGKSIRFSFIYIFPKNIFLREL